MLLPTFSAGRETLVPEPLKEYAVLPFSNPGHAGAVGPFVPRMRLPLFVPL
jgi:hypothetical protein